MKKMEVLSMLIAGMFASSTGNASTHQIDCIHNQKVPCPLIHRLQYSAIQGDPAAQVELARMYQLGLGMRSNPARAAIWYKKAAEQGDADAQFNLGLMYLEGVGVTANSNEALNWISRAADQKHDSATEIYNYMLYNDGPLEC